MKKGKKDNNVSLIISIVFVILGLFLFIKPDITIEIISYIMGISLIVLGVISIIKYFKSDIGISTFSFDLVYGVLVIIAGIYFVVKPGLLEVLFPTILGIWIIINSVTKFQYALILNKLKKNDFKYILLISILSFAWGIILLVNPLDSILKVTQIIGVFIIIYSILDIMDNFILRRNIEDLNKMYIVKVDVKEEKNNEK